MTLDHWLVARLARDLDARLRGSRIEAIAYVPQGVLFFCYRRGTFWALHAVLDSNAPLACAYECDRPEKHKLAGGWLGDVQGILRGARIDGVSFVPHDRVLLVDASSRSAFGVPSRSRIVLELQPRKANALVLRISSEDGSWVTVAAQKQFAAGQKRGVTVGRPYEQPPARRAKLDRAQFIVAVNQVEGNDAKPLERLLSSHDPDCSPPLAKEVVLKAAASGQGGKAHALLAAWESLRAEVRAALERGADVFVWRNGERIELCHLVSLTWPEGTPTTEPALNDVCVGLVRGRPADSTDTTRTALRKKLATLLQRCELQTQSLRESLARVSQADKLRQAGDAIYAHLREIVPGSTQFTASDGLVVELDPRLSPSANAADYFRKYKKARSALAPVRARLETLQNNREYWEHLMWELEREDLEPPQRITTLNDIKEALGVDGQRRSRARGQPKPAVRTPLDRARQRTRVELGDGVAAYVGRSPKENDQLTFRVAGPNDYWFHARGVPGAHVIVKIAGSLTERQINEAAKLAARNSRAAGESAVDVDYTRRKHVRRRGASQPGLVWYTDYSTVRVHIS